MQVQSVMDHTGDTRHEFNDGDQAGLAEAEKLFMELTGAGFTAAKRTGNGMSKLMSTFYPTAEETLFFPRLIAG